MRCARPFQPARPGQAQASAIAGAKTSRNLQRLLVLRQISLLPAFWWSYGRHSLCVGPFSAPRLPAVRFFISLSPAIRCPHRVVGLQSFLSFTMYSVILHANKRPKWAVPNPPSQGAHSPHLT